MNSLMPINTQTVYTSAAAGIGQGFERLASNTQVIANPNSSTDSVTQSLINNQLTATEIEALVKTLKTHDQLIGQLLDIQA